MRTRHINAEVDHAEDPLVLLDEAYMQGLVQQGQANPRQRMRLCTHIEVTDPLHEMFIVHTDAVYVRPHKHLNKSESLTVLSGQAVVVFFDEAGNIDQCARLGAYGSGHKFYYRISAPIYHTLLFESPVFVFHEATQGPFRREDTVFPTWAPTDDNPAEVQAYLEGLKAAVQKVGVA